jgi:hypothetical protein
MRISVQVLARRDPNLRGISFRRNGLPEPFPTTEFARHFSLFPARPGDEFARHFSLFRGRSGVPQRRVGAQAQRSVAIVHRRDGHIQDDHVTPSADGVYSVVRTPPAGRGAGDEGRAR